MPVTTEIEGKIQERSLSISDLERLVEQLPPFEKGLFHDQYELRHTLVASRYPDSMKLKIPNILGVTAEEAALQLVVNIQDRWLKEKAKVCPIRSMRPRRVSKESAFKQAISELPKEDCAFCDPLNNTPTNGSERTERGLVVSCGNLTPFADYHELLLFDHDPYQITSTTFTDIIDMGLAMAQRQYRRDQELKHFSLIFNFGYKAGASQIHGHAQVLLDGGSMHCTRVELYNAMAQLYRNSRNRDFFTDKFKIYQALGLEHRIGEDVVVIDSLTPRKDRGVLIFDDSPNSDRGSVSDQFKNTCYQVWRFMLDKEGVEEFNFALFLPPFGSGKSDWWRDFRSFAEFVDRGSSRTYTNDYGAMEAQAQVVVVEQDPLRWGPELGKYLSSSTV